MPTRDARPADDPPLNPRWALLLAVVALVAVRELVPFGRQILYPFTLLSTWVHEMGHGLAALLVGGSFDKLEIFADASGLAHGSSGPGWPRAFRAMGGLLGPPLVGAVLLATARGPKRATIILWVLAVALAVSTAVWVRSVTGWVALPALAAFFALVAYKVDEDLRQILAQLLGLLLALDTVTRIDYLFARSATVNGNDNPSDVANIAEAIGGHYLLWGALLTVVSLGLLVAGLKLSWAAPLGWKRAFRRDRPRRTS